MCEILSSLTNTPESERMRTKIEPDIIDIGSNVYSNEKFLMMRMKMLHWRKFDDDNHLKIIIEVHLNLDISWNFVLSGGNFMK